MNKELLKDWFHYHLSARRGILVLCLLLLLSVACKIYLPKWIKPEITALSAQSYEVKQWLSIQTNKVDSIHSYSNETQEKSVPIELFLFDPNTIDDLTWEKLGLSEGQIKSIRKFIAAGGKFKIKSDLAKMYVVSAELYAQWEPFIQLPSELIREEYTKISDTSVELKKTFSTLNINTADSTELLNLPGIGPYYAGAIVKYRNRLGGFLKAEQLLEIWKMKPETIELIREKIFIDQSDVKFIYINTVGAEELALHPYLNGTKARALISYRDKHGPFLRTEDIKNCVVLDETTFNKIVEYIKL